MSVLGLFVYALVGMRVEWNEVCSSGFGWQLVDRRDVEYFALRGVDRDLSATDSVWSFASGCDGWV